MRQCTFPGCTNPHDAKGLCKGHYAQQRLGKPLEALYSRKRRDHEPPRLTYREVPCLVPGLIGPCWEWAGGSSKGYGHSRIEGKAIRVHRYAWEQKNGPIPEGMVTDHRCRNRACCNPDHLRLVTNRTNTLENSEGEAAKNAAKTHCKNGHPFDESSIRHWPSGTRRVCPTCIRQSYLKGRKKRGKPN